MSYIPDCRSDEDYNEKILNKDDSNEVRGYDWAAEMADNFFNNLPFADDSYIMHFLNEEIKEDKHDTYEVISDFGVEPQPEKRTVRTYADLIRKELLDYIESERDELITSMIEGMDDDEYEANKKRFLEEKAAAAEAKEGADDGRTAEAIRQGTEED